MSNVTYLRDRIDRDSLLSAAARADRERGAVVFAVLAFVLGLIAALCAAVETRTPSAASASGAGVVEMFGP